MNKSNQDPSQDIIQVVLDQTRIYMEESLGSVMVRGEVILNFPQDTPILGPIELLFEGIQRFYPWTEIMAGSFIGSLVETKLQVIELSLLPPNSQGLMPAGIQRFPFEFPIPTSLPTTLHIKNRMDIFYQLNATLRRSGNDLTNWIDRTRCGKRKYTAQAPIRIVGSVGSATRQVRTGLSTQQLLPVVPSSSSSSFVDMPWDRHSLDSYQSNITATTTTAATTFDDQHDLLISSLSGRSVGNLTRPLQDLSSVQGIKYKLGIDQTAIALGTNIGIEVMVEPTWKDAVVKKIVLKVLEKRRYTLKVPAGHTWGITSPKVKRCTEKTTAVLKWAHGYPAHDEDGLLQSGCTTAAHESMFIRDSISQHTSNISLTLVPDDLTTTKSSHECRSILQDNKSDILATHHLYERAHKPELINLKELDQVVCVGECFSGRFVMPVPDCSTHILHPSMNYDSIDITHWLQLIVTIKCNDKIFDLNLESPGYVLDCRLVNDDDHQTLIPSPPAYNPKDTHIFEEKSTFWEQRNPITQTSHWGTCAPCPCETKKLKSLEKKNKTDDPNTVNMNYCSLPLSESPPLYSEK